MAWLAWSSFLPGWPENSKFQGKLRANYGEILQLSGMHEDEGRAVVGYACQMGRWRGPAYTLVWDSVSEGVKTAFNSSQQVYFEIDDEKPDTSCAMLPPGQKLTQVSVQRDVMTTINGIRDHP